jgi:flagellar M-ring protein FliF
MQQLGGPNARHLLAMMLAAATAVALALGAWMWTKTPDYRVLFSNVGDRDGGAIIAALGQMNVPYKFADGGGAIMVPAERVHEARLRLASQGLPKGSLVGFELMETSRLGTSQFLEQVNYQRALEGELARSIQSLGAVASARVHLAIPKPSVFLRDQQKPSASVLVNLGAGRSLESGQVSAIVHLVSSSVADLPVKNVTVVDQNGNLLSTQGDMQQNGLDPGQLKYLKDLEHGYAQRIETLLEPMLGPGNVRAQVTADLDFSQIEQAEEAYRPNQGAAASIAVRSQNSSESSSGAGAAGAGGVPGALSNQPPSPATAPVNNTPAPAQASAQQPPGAPGQQQAANATPAPAVPTSSRKDSSINYEVDKTLKHTRLSTGNVRRLSVAVLVNHSKVAAKDGKVSMKARTADEMAQIDKLVREAMGFSQPRGDSVSVVNSPFTTEDVQVPEAVPFWKQPSFIALALDIGKHLLIALLVLFVFLRVLKPTFQSLLAARPAPAATAALPGGEMSAGELAPPGRAPPSYERNLDSAKQLARQEPALVANIVRNWVAGE